MSRSDADTLWRIASGLAREAAKVSRPAVRPRPALPPLLFFTDPERTPGPWTVAAALPAGAGVVYRHFGAPDARETALRLREVTRAGGVLLLIGRDTALAEDIGADGVHLPEVSTGEAATLSAAHPGWLITAAFHDHTALPDPTGIDALVVSPIFQAGGVSAASEPLGIERLRALTRLSSRPVYALGGIDASNARRIEGSGVCGIAGVGSIRAAFGTD